MRFIKAIEIERLLFKVSSDKLHKTSKSFVDRRSIEVSSDIFLEISSKRYKINKHEFDIFVKCASCFSLCRLISNTNFDIEISSKDWIKFYAENHYRISTLFTGADYGRLHNKFYRSKVGEQIEFICEISKVDELSYLTLEYINHMASFGSKRLNKVKRALNKTSRSFAHNSEKWINYCDLLAEDKFDIISSRNISDIIQEKE